MLPFLHSKIKGNGAMIASAPGKADLEMKSEDNPNSEMQELEFMAEDILRAIESKSPIELAKALKQLFEVLESMPHSEESLDDPFMCSGGMR